jgi:hypothetical protein
MEIKDGHLRTDTVAAKAIITKTRRSEAVKCRFKNRSYSSARGKRMEQREALKASTVNERLNLNDVGAFISISIFWMVRLRACRKSGVSFHFEWRHRQTQLSAGHNRLIVQELSFLPVLYLHSEQIFMS